MDDLVNQLRRFAEDLRYEGGFDGSAMAMSQAADEIVKLREHVAIVDAEQQRCHVRSPFIMLDITYPRECRDRGVIELVMLALGLIAGGILSAMWMDQ